MMEALAIFLGGGLGSLSRWGLGVWLGKTEGGFPLGTLAANLAACIILGFLTGMLLRKVDIPRPLQAGALTGFCGGFSTFSTFSGETAFLFDSGKTGLALLYIGASLILCLGGIFLGQWFANRLFT